MDEDADLECPTRVSLIDTRTSTLRLVDLSASYSFRCLGRGPEDQAMVLGTGRRLDVIDPETGEISFSPDVVEPWTEPLDWLDLRATLDVLPGDRPCDGARLSTARRGGPSQTGGSAPRSRSTTPSTRSPGSGDASKHRLTRAEDADVT